MAGALVAHQRLSDVGKAPKAPKVPNGPKGPMGPGNMGAGAMTGFGMQSDQ